MSMRTVGSLSVLASIAIAACSSGTGGTTASTSEAFVGQYCDALAPCCAKAGLPSDGKSCKALFGLLAGAQGPYNAMAGNACLAELHAASSRPDFCDSATSNPDAPDCKNVYRTAGTKAPGEACTKDNDCASSTEGTVRCAFGFVNGGGQTQTCQLQIVGKEGDTPCVATLDGGRTTSSSGSGMPPARGFTCNRKDNLRCDNTTTKCTAVQDIGGPCTFGSSVDSPCVKAAYCDTAMKLCVARKPAGADCDTFSSGQCADGLYCDATKKCATSLAAGASCMDSRACASASCINQMCSKSGVSDFGLALVCGTAK